MSAAMQIHGFQLNAESGEPMIRDTELAEKLGYAAPRNIRKIVRRMLKSGSLSPESMRSTVERIQNGNTIECFYLSERAALKVIARSETSAADKITDEVIDVFIQYRQGTLAQQPATAIPTNLVEALRLAADKAEEAEKLALKVERDAPKVQFHDRVAMAEDACTVAEAAKLIGTGRNRLFTRLREIGWLTRRNEPYQQVISSGLMDVKIGKWEHPEQGLKESITPLITGKGLSKLQSLYQEQMALV